MNVHDAVVNVDDSVVNVHDQPDNLDGGMVNGNSAGNLLFLKGAVD